jgi:uncharacterized protein
MVRFQSWQWLVLIVPIALVVTFLLVSAGFQIHAWGLSWLWGVIGLMFLVHRWLLVRWTRPAVDQMEALVAELAAELPQAPGSAASPQDSPQERAAAALYQVINDSRQDPPIWQDWNLFWQRALSLVGAIAQIYKPQAQQPLLNIYIPQAYSLMRGTMDDLSIWMQKMTPVLNQVTVEQAFQAYEMYQKMQPDLQRLLRVWQWSQWIRNPIAAVARTASQGSRDRANQELLGNFGQMLRETILRNLAQQAIALYGGTTLGEAAIGPEMIPALDTQTLEAILAQASPEARIAERPLNILLVGRTGSGKSSLINTLFTAPQAPVDALPSTDQIRDYHWQREGEEALILWDTPGYEQVGQLGLRDRVLQKAREADLILLVTPATDPALQMDRDFLDALGSMAIALPPLLGVITQVDRLRPLREWSPPYDWQQGTRPKEIAMREALNYRTEVLPALPWLPLVAWSEGRSAWGDGALGDRLLALLPPAKQERLGRFLKSRELRVATAAGIIDRYSQRMTTQRGVTAFLKSPVLHVLAAITAGSPAYAPLLAEKIPAENLPLVIGKAQMAYDLYRLLEPNLSLDWLKIWPLVTHHQGEPDLNAWAFGQSLTAYWSQTLPADQDLMAHFEAYFSQKATGPVGPQP